ncbi:MAG: TlpA family protein disulfide reductase [Phycisphaerales bacterium]|nr:TlpA family protein disulfide reductase [Phycisphaerales bacterium]
MVTFSGRMRAASALAVCLVVGAPCLGALPSTLERPGSSSVRGPMLPGAGWKWHKSPERLDLAWAGVSPIALATPAGMLNICARPRGGYFVLLTRRWGGEQAEPVYGPQSVQYRVVVSDEAGTGLDVVEIGSQSSVEGGLYQSQFEFLAPPDGSPVVIGVAALPPEGRGAYTRALAERVRNLGMEPLPCPVVGEALTCDLPRMGGGRVSSASWAGSVTVLHCWATWCEPSMRELDTLRRVRREHPDVQIVGLNFDRDPDAATGAIAEEGLDWDHVDVPGIAGRSATRLELWNDAFGMRGLPRVIVVGRDGRVIADGASAVGRLVDEAIKD